MAAVLLGAILLTEPDFVVSRWRNIARGGLTYLAQSASDRYEREGQTGLRNFLDRVKTQTGLDTYLFDDQGHELSGRGAPEGASAVSLKALGSSRPEFRFGIRSTLGAYPAVGADGRRWVGVVRIPRSRLGLQPSSLFAWALRLAAVLATAGLLCYWLARYVTGPVLQLSVATRRFSEGDLSARVNDRRALARHDELAVLSRDFNEMAGRIERLVQGQNRLMGDISHELRSPLTRLTVALGILRRNANDDLQPGLDRIERESDRLNLLIERLLTLARLEARASAHEPVPIGELLDEIVRDASYEASNANRIVRRADQCEIVVSGSRELLGSAIENVVRNAIRYTSEATEVSVSLAASVEGSTCLVISDRGPGVPEAALPHLFEPFYRVATSRDRKSGGTGLGLAIAQRAVLAHGGQITARNRIGGGLEVEINLPNR